MKSLVFALVAALAFAAGAPAAQAAAPAAPAGVSSGQAVSAHVTGQPHTHYTKKKTGYWYRGRWHTTYRAPRRAVKPRAWAAAKSAAAGGKKWQLPEYAPKYSASGKYIPTQYIYQQTNGEFRILTPPAPPAAKAAGTPGGAAEVRRALQGINGQAGGAVTPPAPPAGAGTAPAGGGTAPAAPAGRGGPGNP